jgi:multidrug resistance efflux pump
MSTFILDTLAYADTLKAGGFTPQQAETQARALAEILNRMMEPKPTPKTQARDNSPHPDGEALRLEANIAESIARTAKIKADLTRWVIGASVLQVIVLAGLLKMAKLI